MKNISLTIKKVSDNYVVKDEFFKVVTDIWPDVFLTTQKKFVDDGGKAAYTILHDTWINYSKKIYDERMLNVPR